MLCIILLTGFTRGKKELTEDKAREFIKATLDDKYGRNFSVIDLTRENSGIIFANYYYSARVEETGEEKVFGAIMDIDGSSPMDDYESLIYGDSINEKLLDLLSGITDINITNSRVSYYMAQEVSPDLDAYMRENHAMAWLELELDDDRSYVSENLGKEMCELLEELVANGFYYSIVLTGNGKDIHFVHSQSVPKDNVDQITRKVGRLFQD